MEPFRALEAVAVPIDEVNVDTNQLCPTRFNKVPRGPGYERILFHDRRFDAEGNENPDFILNREPYRQARTATSVAGHRGRALSTRCTPLASGRS
jgi:3-isopropylmalate/(R)-2-methylmalate dehydratase small subunit